MNSRSGSLSDSLRANARFMYFCACSRSAQVRVDGAEPRGGEREVRIELERVLEQRNRLHVAGLEARVDAHAVRLQRFERRGRGVVRRDVEPLNRPDRFAELLADAGRRRAHAGQHVGLGHRLRLLAGERVAGLTGLRFERDDVGRGERGDRAEHDGLDAEPLADIAGDGGGHRLVRRPLHQLQGRSDLGCRHDVQIRRLPELDLERVFQGAVENRFASRVEEIGQQERLPRRQRRRGAAVP